MSYSIAHSEARTEKQGRQEVSWLLKDNLHPCPYTGALPSRCPSRGPDLSTPNWRNGVGAAKRPRPSQAGKGRRNSLNGLQSHLGHGTSRFHFTQGNGRNVQVHPSCSKSGPEPAGPGSKSVHWGATCLKSSSWEVLLSFARGSSGGCTPPSKRR